MFEKLSRSALPEIGVITTSAVSHMERLASGRISVPLSSI
jgi:UDP-N-acetylmuramyl pentapeptide synthase